jgi:EAL domain-containing protein (putative c-di-GMP-specific phosphodiesterase class I)
MGIVLRAQASGDADAVLQDASTAMVEARWRGGGRYAIFEPAMQQRAARRGAIEAGLRRALAEGELFVVYQPVVDLQAQARDDPPLRAGDALLAHAGDEPRLRAGDDRRGDARAGAGAGVEALVRWRHPTRGEVGPLEFIGVAEECGLIDALGEFVLATACRQFVAWQQALGSSAPRLLAVNLSRAQLREPGLAAAVHRTLQATGMPPERLQLEVTESLAAQDETVQARLHELKALGLTLALDDFGTGYSSLACLHQLPVDVVKIDRSFVCQADTSPHHRVLIEATVRVAGSLGMQTVAEGIETAAQARVIRELGCDKGQGYFYSRPLTAGAYTRWIEAATAAAASAGAIGPPVDAPDGVATGAASVVETEAAAQPADPRHALAAAALPSWRPRPAPQPQPTTPDP